ncbi:MAG: Ig-like domain-containing protein [Clostridiales bacterium]|nr:Ig-like domain-containing protein [Clostridiales bacterium]
MTRNIVIKPIFKKTAAALTAAVILICSLPLHVTGSYEGRQISFGSYPQSLVTDSALTSSLEIEADKHEFEYLKSFSGDSFSRGSAQEQKLTKYCDFEYEGEKYRCIVLKKYTPYETFLLPQSENSSQCDCGYELSKKYFFLFESITWNVINGKTGLCLSEKTLDAAAFCPVLFGKDVNGDGEITDSLDGTSEYFANENLDLPNTYQVSFSRYFLTNSFATVAFSGSEAEKLIKKDGDAVYYLSEGEIENSENFPSPLSRVAGKELTDYAKCMGVDGEIYSMNTCSAGSAKMYNIQVNEKGELKNSKKNVQCLTRVIPACRIADAVECINHVAGEWEYTGNGNFSVFCSVCRKKLESRFVNLGFEDEKIEIENGKEIKPAVLTDSDFLPMVVFSSDNENICTVSQNGIVNTVNPGQCNITAEITGSDIKADLPVTVKARLFSLTYKYFGESETVFVYEGEKIPVKNPPEYPGYIFKSWSMDLPENMPPQNLEIEGIFEAESYTAVFTLNGDIIAEKNYFYGQKSISMPDTSGFSKTGYEIVWQPYSLKPGGTQINAEYSPIVYHANFVADGKLVLSVPYTVETNSITEPHVPEKAGYSGKWSKYKLSPGGFEIHAQYTLISKLSIKNNPPSKETSVSYREGIKITASYSDLPNGCTLKWDDGSSVIYGPVYERKNIRQSFTLTLSAVDKNGNEVKTETGKILGESEKINVRVSFFIKLSAFFKYLLGSMKTNIQ